MEEFKLLLMWSDRYDSDMWWVERVNDKKGKQDYYGPFFHKYNAQKFLDNEL